MSGKLLFSTLVGGMLAGTAISAFTPSRLHQENQPPLVKINIPADHGLFQWNGLINYSISVTDKEDGNSAFEEIPANEVLLKVVYFPDSAAIKKYLRTNAAVNDPQELSLIKTSDCFNCHAASTKLIGPSFQLIAAKYPGTTSVEAIAGKLVKGSTGTWGNVPMPPHPNLSIADAKAIVLWILNNNRDPNTTFFPGLQGAFRSRQKPAGDASKAVYLLTASYTDHGLKDAPGSAKQGTHTIMLKAR